MEVQGTGFKFVFNKSEALTTNEPAKRGRRKGTKAKKQKSPGDYSKEIFDALKESEMGDSVFLNQYIRSRVATKARRQLNTLEKINRNQAIEKAKKAELNKKEIIARFNTKDFIMVFWELNNGTIYKEVHCRPGLKIGLDDKLQEIEVGFKVNNDKYSVS